MKAKLKTSSQEIRSPKLNEPFKYLLQIPPKISDNTTQNILDK